MEIINCLKNADVKFDCVTDKKIKSISFCETTIDIISIAKAIENGCKNFIIASHLYKDEIESEIRDEYNDDISDLRIFTI